MSDQTMTQGRALESAGFQTWPLAPTWHVRRARDTSWAVARAIGDAVALGAANVIAGMSHPELGAGWYAVLTLATLVAFAGAGSYRPRLRLALADELRRVAAASALITAAVAGLALATTTQTGVGDAAVVHWFVAAGLVAAGRTSLYAVQRSARRRSDRGARTLIVGAGQVGHLTARRLQSEPQLGLHPVGFLDKSPLIEDERDLRAANGLPVMGASWDLETIVHDQRIDHVVIAFSTAPHGVLLDIVRRCWALGVGVLVVPRLYEVNGQGVEVDHLGALPLMHLRTSDPRGWQMQVKYAVDRVVAAIALVALAPVLAVIALAVLVSLGRPVFFRQRRVGRDGHAFEMLKFRTMRGAPTAGGEADAHWASLVVSGTPAEATALTATDRRTPLGQFLRKASLDELPQFWNVVRGDMALVGPRPEREHYVEQFEGVVPRYPERHRVKSGLTGWAQIHGLRGETSLADRIEWDNFYIENWSPWLDFKILLRTVPAMLGRRGGF